MWKGHTPEEGHPCSTSDADASSRQRAGCGPPGPGCGETRGDAAQEAQPRRAGPVLEGRAVSSGVKASEPLQDLT